MSDLVTDLCVIGAGAGGLSVAAGAAKLGLRVVLVERGQMGGECLHTGCVPSKTLLGLARGGPRPWAEVQERLHAVVAAIAPHDSQERFERLGVTVLREHARFVGRDAVRVGDRVIRARRFVVATGSRPAVPPLPGLEAVAFLTTDSVFALERLPERLVVMGGGPVGVELAQAFAALGAQVVVIARSRLLPREDPEMVAPVRAALRRLGVDIREGVAATAAEPGPVLVLSDGSRVAGSHVLIAAGRRPQIDGLDLQAAGIAVGPQGVIVDSRLRTTNRRVLAVGDVTGGPRFTHMAGHQASVVVRNALFRLPARVETVAVPRVTYGDPELAWVGLTPQQAGTRARRVVRLPLASLDRAVCEGGVEGLCMLVVGRRGRVLGGGIVGPRAGDLLSPLTLAVAGRVSLSALAQMIVPYPTLAEVVKAAAGAYYADTVFSPRSRRLVRWLLRLPLIRGGRP